MYLFYRQILPNTVLSNCSLSDVLPPVPLERCLFCPASFCLSWGTPRAAVPIKIRSSISWKNRTFWTDCFSCICIVHKLPSFSGTSISPVSLQLRNILNRVSHSRWISPAPLWSIEVHFASLQLRSEVKELPNQKLSPPLTQHSCTERHHDVYLSIFFLPS